MSRRALGGVGDRGTTTLRNHVMLSDFVTVMIGLLYKTVHGEVRCWRYIVKWARSDLYSVVFLGSDA